MALINRISAAIDGFRYGSKNDSVFTGTTSGSGPLHRSIAVRSTVDSFASAAFNRIAMDACMVEFNHVKMDAEDKEAIYTNTELANCLGLYANIDQTGRQLIQDIVLSMFDEGVVAVVPISVDGKITLRVGRVTDWMPTSVRVECYNEVSGRLDQMVVDKDSTAIIENPLYAVVNGPNTTLRRLVTKINQIDQLDAILSSGQLDIIIQLGVPLHTEKQEEAAKVRMENMSKQLANNRYGVSYIDGNERITQLNRPANDSLLPQIDKLTELFHNQLGLTPNVFNGTASETETRAYYVRTIDPIVTAIAEAFTKAFITKTALTQGQKVSYYRDPFKLVAIEQIPDIIDKTGRNEVMSPNEGRKILGLRPSKDPEADKLKNRNMAPKEETQPAGYAGDPDPSQNESKTKEEE